MENNLIKPSLDSLSEVETSTDKREMEFNKIMKIMYKFYSEYNYSDEKYKEFAENSENQIRNKLIEIIEHSNDSAGHRNIADQIMNLINEAIEKLETVSDIDNILINSRMSTYLSSVRNQMKEVQLNQRLNPNINTTPKTGELREESEWHEIKSPAETGHIPNFFDEPEGDENER